MRILIVSYYDDNFGDMLIRICFERLLKTALTNLGKAEADYTIEKMHLKQINDDAVANADMIMFAGGGLFGLSYLDFFEYIDRITAIAENNDIPVIFSSLGINNMNATEENEKLLIEILKRKCIKAMSVRENPELFRYYANGCNFDIVPVCDPAVWTRYIYNINILEGGYFNNKNKNKVVGINVVRGGLFKANGETWTLGKEEKFLFELKNLLEGADIDYRFYTNGSSLDNNTMGHFAKVYEIPDDKLIFTDTTREVVEAIAGFDAVVAIRMHSSIISYALNVPSIDLVWNDKIPLFYKNIGYPERAIPLDDCTPELIFEKTKILLEDTEYTADKDYMMSLYTYIFDVLCDVLGVEGITQYTFDEVVNCLSALEVGVNEDLLDYKTKLRLSKNRYLSLFTGDEDRKKQIKNLNKEKEKLTEDYERKIDILEQRLQKTNEKLAKTEKKLNQKQNEAAKLKKDLNWINSKLTVRIYRKIRRIGGKVLHKFKK